jgi:hypothetical protein
MCRLIRGPLPLDKCCRPLEPHVHWNHCSSFRWRVVVIASLWGRRTVAHLYRYLDVAPHRTRVNNFCVIERWDPAAALRQQAHERLLAGQPQPGDPVSLLIDAAQKATRGSQLDAVPTMKDPTTEAYMRGHPYVWAILADHDPVIPWGLRLDGKQAHGEALGRPCHQTTALAARLIWAFQAPAGVQVLVWCDADDLGHTGVQAGRDQGCHLASPRTGHRRLCQQGWRRKAGR